MTHLYQFQIKTVSRSGHSFGGFTETDQLVTYNKHESKDFKLKNLLKARVGNYSGAELGLSWLRQLKMPTRGENGIYSAELGL